MSDTIFAGVTEERRKDFYDIISKGVEKAQAEMKDSNDGIETGRLFDLIFAEAKGKIKGEQEAFVLGTMASYVVIEFINSQKRTSALMGILMGGIRPRGDNNL